MAEVACTGEAVKRFPSLRRQPCRFCESEANFLKRQQHYGEHFWVECVCSARGPRHDTKLEAVKAWGLVDCAYNTNMLVILEKAA